MSNNIWYLFIICCDIIQYYILFILDSLEDNVNMMGDIKSMKKKTGRWNNFKWIFFFINVRLIKKRRDEDEKN